MPGPGTATKACVSSSSAQPPRRSRPNRRVPADPVSGLLTQAGFEIAVETAVAEAEPENRSLLMFDLEFPQFENIARGGREDTRLAFLHAMGRRLEEHAGAGGLAARLEGARFTLLLSICGSAEGEAERLADALASTQRLADGSEGVLRPRVGYAVLPDDTTGALELFGGNETGLHVERFAETAASLRSCCDLALSQARSSEATPLVRFSPSLIIARRRREELARSVVPAVANGGMKVAFQPVMDIATMKLVGFEALLRWRHPEYGPVPPPEAIAIAEANGALCDLTRHVMREAVARCLEWPDDLSFAVNVTPSQLNGHLVDLIADVLREGGGQTIVA